MQNAITTTSNGLVSWETMRQQADVMIKSGFLPKAVKTAEQALTIMLMGQALDIPPIVALNTINVIAGKPTVPPQLMIALARRTGQFESMEVTDDGTACTVKLKRKGEPIHVETFSIDDAKRLTTSEWENGQSRTIPLADKKNWREQPATMRKWRAVAASMRIVYPDAILGIASYTPEEMGANVVYDDNGGIISIEAVDEPVPPTKQPPISQDQNWYDDETARRKYINWLAHDDRQLTEKDAEALTGKPARDFATGKEACLAVEAAVSSRLPATPKGTQPADEKSIPWWDIQDEVNVLNGFIARFDLDPKDALKKMDIADWKSFASRKAAEGAIVATAARDCWPMLADRAVYEKTTNFKGDSKTPITFNAPIPVIWWKGRHELADYMQTTGLATVDWTHVGKWIEAEHKLPEKVRIHTKHDDANEYLLIDRIEVADALSLGSAK